MALYDYKKLRLELLKRSARYNAGVKHLYDVALNDMAREFATLDYNPDMVFSFENYGVFGRVDGIMSRLERDIQSVVNAAVANEFGAAYEANNELIRKILGDNVSNEVIRAFAPKLSSGNAAKIFNLEHQSGNITESMRVWNGATLGQMETAVQEALMDGMPAKQMAGLMEEYLNDPESCFRRFRIKTGVDADGKSMYGRKWMKRVRNADGSTSWFDADPRDYPTGQGVYHSSYKNALRYCRNTTNIAYRTADYERYQTEPFVLGIEIHTTNNPAHKEDICDLLAGRYPVDFKWVQWHVNCMCYEVPILATPEEVNAMADAIMNDQDPASVPVAGRVTDVPDNFKQWVADNEDRIQDTLDRGKELPYFLRDNGTVVDNKYISNYSLKTEEDVFKYKTLDELKKEYGDKLPKTLEHLEEAMERYDRLNDEFIPYREDIEKELFKLFEQNDFGMDISPDVLQSVYDNGFYNQFQSGTSSGALYERGITSGPISKSNGRLWASHKMFGMGNDLEASQLARREYEKYGHLLDKDKLDAFLNNLSGYGDVQVRFKKNKVLCTWTFDDSLGTTYQPSLVTDPRIESLDDLATKYMPKKSDPTKLFEWQELKNTSYIELQYHGELTIDAVESMVFRGSPEKSISMSLIKKLLDKGIELFYYQAGEIHQFVL